MTISCLRRKFKPTVLLLCSQSPFPDAALKGGFRVSGVLDWVVAN
jgi:hypothetical protein